MATALPAMTQNGSSYLPPTTRSIFPLALYNRSSVQNQFVDGTSNSQSTFYTLYPPQSSTQYSRNYCASNTVPLPTTFSSHTLGTVPLFSGLHSSLTTGVLKHDKETSSFAPLTHICEVLPQNPVNSDSYVIGHADYRDVISTSSPQQALSERPTSSENESMVIKCSQSPSPLNPNPSLCPAFPGGSTCASTPSDYNQEPYKPATPASVQTQSIYDPRSETKPLFHLPNNRLEIIMRTSPNNSSKRNPEWTWSGGNATSDQSVCEAEITELAKVPNDTLKAQVYADVPKNELSLTTTTECVQDHKHVL